jgi:uncharacterized membrane protein YuzA (DUF378 family)
MPNRNPNLESSSPLLREHELRVVDWIALVLLIGGGINWGLVGAFEFNLVSKLFGPSSIISRTIYVLVGIAALYAIYGLSRLARARP